jgi:hypothetical protein
MSAFLRQRIRERFLGCRFPGVPHSPDDLGRPMSWGVRGGWFFEPESRPSEDMRRDRIELRSVRHLIERHQQTIDLPHGRPVALHWVPRTGGTFGPKSSAAANQRQRTGRSAPPAPLLDRGSATAWHVYFRCPRCDRSCLVLHNPLWRWREIISKETLQGAWCCQTCGHYRWPSDRWTGTSRRTGRRPPSYWYQSHSHAADRIEALMEEPRWLTIDRWVALSRLREAHLTLAAAAAAAAAPRMLDGVSAAQVERARQAIEECRWATRQRGWARRGKPRPGPEGRTG